MGTFSNVCARGNSMPWEELLLQFGIDRRGVQCRALRGNDQ